jgi:hypothetical protein
MDKEIEMCSPDELNRRGYALQTPLPPLLTHPNALLLTSNLNCTFMAESCYFRDLGFP